MVFDVREFGAVGDGKTKNTEYVQKAIDACFKAGGGQVLIAGGRYMIGSVELRSNVELHIAADGVLFGSPECKDYPEKENAKHIVPELLPRKRSASMIFAEECENISITGKGVIDCNGKAFVILKEGKSPYGWRYERIDAPTPPRVVFFTGCRNVLVEDITMQNQPAGWSYWIHDCDYVTFDRVKILADVEYPNNDGIHINSSRNVTVSNSLITCGDDCLVVRANNRSLAENKVCEKVTVTNCNLTSWSGGIRIGWLNDGVIRNCAFSNLVMTDTSVGISLLLPGLDLEQTPDHGREATLIENLTFDNIIMDKINSTMLCITIDDHPDLQCAAVRNLYFHNIHARGNELPRISGRENCFLENIYFSDCTFERTGELQDNHGHSTYWDHNFHPMYTKYVKNLVFNHTTFTVE